MTINYIPLSGTTTEKPVTGSVKILGDNGISFDADLGIYTSGISFAGDSTSLFFRDNENVKHIGLVIGQTLQVVSNDENSQGLIGNIDFSLNATDLAYVQKKYVDAKITELRNELLGNV